MPKALIKPSEAVADDIRKNARYYSIICLNGDLFESRWHCNRKEVAAAAMNSIHVALS